MLTLDGILDFLSTVPTTTALAVLAIAACSLVAAQDWRLSIFAVILHYALAGLFLTRIIREDIALVKTLVGAMVCITLYITARRASEAKPLSPSPPGADPSDLPADSAAISRLRLESGWPFRLLVAILGLAVAFTASSRIVLPSTPPEVILACSILFAQGLLALCLTSEPLQGGLGILTVIIGFDLFYSGIQQSLVIVGLLGLVNFAIALSIAYLTTLQASVPLEETYP